LNQFTGQTANSMMPCKTIPTCRSYLGARKNL